MTAGLACACALLAACSNLAQAPAAPLQADTTTGQPADQGSAPAGLPTPGSPPVNPALPRMALQGQISIKLGALGDQAAQGLSLGFFFTGNAQAGQLDLMTLMGSQVAQVGWQADQAWLVNDKGRQRHDSIEALSEAALGEALPLRSLIYWMQGQPDPAIAQAPCSDEQNSAGTFTQIGWTIDTRDLAQKKLTAQRPGDATHRAALIKVYLDR
jgi:outer membrane biogenesis lipoprotein LolB